jgi:hypothetical protein
MSNTDLRRVLIGLQADPGVGVNVDFALRALMSLKPNVDKIVPDENIGSLAPARHYIGSIMPEGTLTVNDGVYDEIPYILALALGGETPAGAGSPYTWTWDLPDDTAPTHALFTVEYTDGGTWVVRGEDVIATGLTISGVSGKGWKFEAPITGGDVTYPGAITADPSLVAAPTPIRMADTVLYVDADYGDIGTSDVPATLISFSWKLENLLHTKLFAGSLFPNGRGSAKWKTTLELIVEAEEAVFQTEMANLLDTTQSAIQVKASSGAFSLSLDGNYMLQNVDTLDDRDGNNIVKLTYQGEKDASDNTGQIIALSSLDAL